MDDHHADELLRRALIDADASAAVALRVGGPPALRDSSRSSSTAGATSARSRPTSPTAAAARAAPSRADELLRVPCDLDLGRRADREEAEQLYAEQAGALRDALWAPTPCSTSGASRSRTSRIARRVDRRVELDVRLPAHRLLPAALVAKDKQIVVTAVCGARPLAEGRPPMGIACAQQDVARVYPLPDDPERCLEDFLEFAADHARRVADGSTARSSRSSASSRSRPTTSPRAG